MCGRGCECVVEGMWRMVCECGRGCVGEGLWARVCLGEGVNVVEFVSDVMCMSDVGCERGSCDSGRWCERECGRGCGRMFECERECR